MYVVHLVDELAFLGFGDVADWAQTANGWWGHVEGGASASPVEAERGRNCICVGCGSSKTFNFYKVVVC